MKTLYVIVSQYQDKSFFLWEARYDKEATYGRVAELEKQNPKQTFYVIENKAGMRRIWLIDGLWYEIYVQAEPIKISIRRKNDPAGNRKKSKES